MGIVSDDSNAYVMGFFLSLSIINVYETCTTFFKRKYKLDLVQAASSVSQIMNLILHMVLNTAKNIDCNHAVNAETFFFYFMQLGSGYVIIYRATAIITQPRRRNLIRYGLAIILATSVGLNLASDILRDMQIIDGVCVPIFHRQLNDASKIVLAVVYIGILIAFITPVVQNLRSGSRYIDTSSLKHVATVTAMKVSFAIIVLLVTVILSIVGVFGAFFWIQFTVQNFAMIWASTVASRRTSNDGGSGVIGARSRQAPGSGYASNKMWSHEMPSRSYDPKASRSVSQFP